MFREWEALLTSTKSNYPFQPLTHTLQRLLWIIWLYTFWSRCGQEKIKKLLTYCQPSTKRTGEDERLKLESGHSSSSPGKLVRWLIVVGVIGLTIFAHKLYKTIYLEVMLREADDKLCRPVFGFTKDLFMGFFLEGDDKCWNWPECSVVRSVHGLPKIRLEWDWGSGPVWESSFFLLLVPHHILKYGMNRLPELITGFCLIGGLVANSACDHFAESVSNLSERYNTFARVNISDKAYFLEKIATEYGKLIELLSHFSNIWGIMLLVYFIYFFPFATEVVFNWIEFSKYKAKDDAARDFLQVTGLITAVLVAAEGCKKVSF